jgi:FCD domain
MTSVCDVRARRVVAVADPADQLLDQRDHHQAKADRQGGSRHRRRQSEHWHRPSRPHAGETKTGDDQKGEQGPEQQDDEDIEHQSGAQRQEIGERGNLIVQKNAVAAVGDFAGFTGLDDHMHAWLFNRAGMGRLWSAIYVKKAHLDRICFLHVPEPGKIKQVAEQHVAILDAIEAGDRTATETRVREHTSGSVLYLDTLLVERPELFDSPRLSRPKQGGTAGSGSPAGPPDATATG